MDYRQKRNRFTVNQTSLLSQFSADLQPRQSFVKGFLKTLDKQMQLFYRVRALTTTTAKQKSRTFCLIDSNFSDVVSDHHRSSPNPITPVRLQDEKFS
jgi:hypothetical protein